MNVKTAVDVVDGEYIKVQQWIDMGPQPYGKSPWIIQLMDQIFDLREKAFCDALIKLGWTPPPTATE